jgi:hypothetical protein
MDEKRERRNGEGILACGSEREDGRRAGQERGGVRR